MIVKTITIIIKLLIVMIHITMAKKKTNEDNNISNNKIKKIIVLRVPHSAKSLRPVKASTLELVLLFLEDVRGKVSKWG